MGALKTSRTTASVNAFLSTVADAQRREDCRQLVRIMRQVTRQEPRMWGPSIVGFGSYHYVYASGREGDWFLTGFSPRKQALTVYVMAGLARYAQPLRALGPHTTGSSCLYLRRLADVDLAVLTRLIRDSVRQGQATYR